MSNSMYIKLLVLICYSVVACQNKDKDETHLIQRAQIAIEYLKTNDTVTTFIEWHTGSKPFSYKVDDYNIRPILLELESGFSIEFIDSLKNSFVPEKTRGLSHLSNSWFPNYKFYFTKLPEDKLYCQLFINPKTYSSTKKNEPLRIGRSIIAIISFNEANIIKDVNIHEVTYN